MNNVVKMKGEIVQRITIEVDESGMTWVEAFEFGELAGKKIILRVTPKPMDSREMVMLLFRIAHDYTAKIFEQLGSAISAKKGNHGTNI